MPLELGEAMQSVRLIRASVGTKGRSWARRCLVLLLAGCAPFGDPRSSEDGGVPRRLARTAGGNISRGCVAAYDSTVDYFPEKAVVPNATQFTLEYHRHYKVLTITPRNDSSLRYRFALVQCGTPAPTGFESSRIVRVPVERAAVTHSDYYSVIDTLNLYDRIVAVGPAKEVSVPRLRVAIESGRVAEVGSQAHLDLETLLSRRPDVILSYWSVSPEFNAPAKVAEVGLRGIPLVAHWERHPLGALDWAVAFAAFFNREGDASQITAAAAARYDTLRQKVASDTQQIRYISFGPSRDRWMLHRVDHSAHRRFADAGLLYAFEALVDSATFPSTTLESAIAAGKDAPFLLDARGAWSTLADVRKADSRLADFASIRSGQVWAFDRGTAPPDRVPWGDGWLMHPDVMLADIIAITRPSLLPGHSFTYVRRVGEVAP